MPGLTLLKAGLQTLLVFPPQSGLAQFAVPSGGPMDPESAAVGRLLLRLPEEHPVLEVTALAPTLQFDRDTRIVLTGADFGWTIDGKIVLRNFIVEVPAGSTLRGKFSPDGLRGYVCIEGKFERRKRILSTRPLKDGDRLEWNPLPEFDAFPLRRGPEFERLTTESAERLTTETFRISTASNRMGARLEGIRLEAQPPGLTDSVPVLPGFVQLPPGGEPIVVLNDGQTTGGYPRIAYLHPRELGRFCQIPLRGTVRFRWA